MSGRHHIDRNNRPHRDPLIINRDPVVIERSPEATVRRASSETRKPKKSTLFSIYNPFRRTRQNTVTVTEQATVRRRNQDREDEPPLLRPVSRRGRRSSPPPPPLIIQRSRSQPPIRIIDKMPASGQEGFFPLPPRLPEAANEGEDATTRRHEERRHREGTRGRDEGEPRRHRRRRTRIVEEDDVPAESSAGRRSPRPYSHRSGPRDPFDQQEQVIEPPHRSSGNFEIVRPNEPARSRQRDSDVLGSREYIEMKALAERNYRAAEDAVQRCSSAEVRIQNLRARMADMALDQNKDKGVHDRIRHELDETRSKLEAVQITADEVRTQLERELDETRRKLEQCRQEHRLSSRDRDIGVHEARLRENQLELERQRAREVERDRERDRNSSSNERRRRPRIITIDRDGHEVEPTPQDPRASTTSATASGDAGMSAIEKARAEAAARRISR